MPPLPTSLLWAMILAAALAPQAGAGVNLPDWVRQAKQSADAPLAIVTAETKAVVLLDHTDYTVLSSGEYVEHLRWAVKLLRPDGRDEAELTFRLRQGEKLNYVHAWTVDRSEHEYELKQKDFVEKGFPSFILYDDIRWFTAQAPAADTGSVIAFEFEVRRHSYSNEINRPLQDMNPVREARITLSLPPGWEFKDAWQNQAPLKAREVAPNRWEWVAENLPGIEEEPMMPPAESLMARLAIAYFAPGELGNTASWQSLGRWYNTLTAGRRDPTPEITAATERLIQGKSDFDGRLRALTGFLQSEIRYVAIEIGLGGYQPHAATDIFRYRYGDCKDKATLLSSMLKVAGIDSHYVLIHTMRGFVSPSIPGIWFNHVILAIELPEAVKADAYPSTITSVSSKRYILFDPTDEYTPVGLLRSELEASYALLVSDSGGELIRTPVLRPDTNSVERTGHFVLAVDGSLAGEIAETRGGDFASLERGRLHNWDERERTQHFERWLGQSLQGFTVEDLNVEQAGPIDKDLLIRYRLHTRQYAQARGPLMLVRPRVLDEKGAFVEHKPRHYPIELMRTARETDTYEIEIPKEYGIEELPDPVDLDVGFARYRSRIEAVGSKLRYSREYLVRDITVPTEKFPDWVKLQLTIGADEAAAVVLKRMP